MRIVLSKNKIVANMLSRHFGYRQFAFLDAIRVDVAKKYNIDKGILHYGYNHPFNDVLKCDEQTVALHNPDKAAIDTARQIWLSNAQDIVIRDWKSPGEFHIIRDIFKRASICLVEDIRTVDVAPTNSFIVCDSATKLDMYYTASAITRLRPPRQ